MDQSEADVTQTVDDMEKSTDDQVTKDENVVDDSQASGEEDLKVPGETDTTKEPSEEKETMNEEMEGEAKKTSSVEVPEETMGEGLVKEEGVNERDEEEKINKEETTDEVAQKGEIPKIEEAMQENETKMKEKKDGEKEEEKVVKKEEKSSSQEHVTPIPEGGKTVSPPPADEDDEEAVPTYEYDYDSMYSRPTVVDMDPNALELLHSFGYECQKRSNLIALDSNTLMYSGGNYLVLLNMTTKHHTYLRTLGGGGIGAITVHPSHDYFAVGEKGDNPLLAIYCYPSLKLHRILREGTEQQYSHMDFSPRDGKLLASIGGYPDYMLTVWNWESESIVLRSKAFSQDIYRVSFSPELPGQLTTSGTGHIRFWKMALTFTGLKLQGYLGKFGQTELSDISAYVELPDGKVLSGSEWGNMLLWDGGFIKVELCKKGKKFCHNGTIEVLYLDEGEVISTGADGFIRIWNFESIDNADTTEDNAPFEIEPLTEIKVGSDVSIKSLCRSNDPDTPTLWFGQDANGAIWKLDIVASHTRKPSEKLVSYHSGEILNIDCSPDGYMAGSIGEDGSVRVCSLESSEVLCHVKYPMGGSSLIWAPLTVDSSGMTLITGFTDGVVRILKIDKDSLVSRSATSRKGPNGKITLINVSKPHTKPVTAIAVDPEGSILATGSEDATVFFLDLKNNFTPIGYVKVPAPVSCMTWSASKQVIENTGSLRLLVCCNEGSAAEIVAPLGEYDTSQSYHLESVEIVCHKFASIKDRLRKEEADAAKAAEKEKKRKAKEAAKKARREKRKADLGDDYRSDEEEDDEDNEDDDEKQDEGEEGQDEGEEDKKQKSSDGPSSIHAAFYDHQEPDNFWISWGGYDAGYLYRGTLKDAGNGCEMYEAPHTIPVPPMNDEDIPIHSMLFSKTGDYLLTGTGNGCIRVYQLGSPYTMTSLEKHWTLSYHDNHYGQVNTMSLSYDGKYLVSGGADGNMFVYKTDLPTVSKYTRSDTKSLESTQILREPSDVIQDIDDSAHYSIEDAKRKAEHDRMMKAAEEKKQQVRREIAKLRRQFTQLQQESGRLPQHLRLTQDEFIMDPSMAQELQQQLQEKIELVKKEMAWESEKHQIALNKIKQRFRDCLECERIVVHGVQHQQTVSSLRTAFPSKRFLELLEKLVETDVNLTPWTAQDGGPKIVSRKNTRHTLEVDDKMGNKLEEIDEGKQLTKSEARRLKKEKRKKEWEELYKIKPGDNFEDPKEVEAIQKAKRELGDYKLKTSNDFIVSEDQRTSTAKKRKEMVLCRNAIFEMKRSFNKRLLSLRDKKLSMIEKIKRDVKKIKEIQSKMPKHLHKPVPPVPKLHSEEVPEREFEFTKESLLKFKKELEKREEAAKQAQAGGEGFGGFGGFGGGDQQEEEQTEQGEGFEDEGAEETSSGSGISIDSTVMIPSDDHHLSDLEKTMANEQEIVMTYQRDSMLALVEKDIKEFDKLVLCLRHERSLEEIKIKSAEMKHLTQFEELELLKEFEKRESNFTGKYRAKKQEKSDLEVKIEEIEWAVKDKEALYHSLIDQQKTLDSTFTESVGENNKFKEFLMKVYRKKIKRAKIKAQKDDADEDEDDDDDDDDEDSDSDSDWSSEDESDEEGGFDDSVCPSGCDQGLFDLAVEMREKRLDLEEALADEKKSLDSMKKELDGLMKKAKTVEAHVKTALQELQAFQLKKQQRMNELDAIVVLKLHQILHYQPGGAPPTNVAQCLVFPASAREHLANRIGELVQEKQHEKKRYRELRQHHVRLVRERKEMDKKVAVLNDKANEMMMLKFGRIVNLDALEGLTTNKMIGELEDSLQMEERRHDIAMARTERKINEARKELLSVIRENTDKTNRLHALKNRSSELEEELSSRQKASGTEMSGYNAFEPEEKARLLQIVQIQNQEIQALRNEIQMLSLKGGKLLPPPQAPGAMTESIIR